MKKLMLGFKTVVVNLLVLCSAKVYATDIGAPSTGFFSQVGGWLQAFVDFIEGPWGLFVSIIALAIAIGVWMFSTRGNEQLGWIGRVVIGVLLIVNIPGLIIALSAF